MFVRLFLFFDQLHADSDRWNCGFVPCMRLSESEEAIAKWRLRIAEWKSIPTVLLRFWPSDTCEFEISNLRSQIFIVW